MPSYKQSVLELLIQGDNRSAVAALRGTKAAAGRFVDDTVGHFGRLARSVVNLQNLVAAGAAAMSAKAIFTPTMKMEDWKKQIENITKDTEKASIKLKDLEKFSIPTPFTPQEVIQSGITLDRFTGQQLDTIDMLRIVGDTAASVGKEKFGELSMWIGRAYAGIQGGEPIGEATMRLMELGAITPQVKTKIEKLQKAGASSSEVWGTLTGALKEHDGAMARFADNASAKISIVEGQWAAAMNEIGSAAESSLKVVLDDVIAMLNDLISSGELERWGAAASIWINRAWEALKGLAAFIEKHGDTLKTLGMTYAGLTIIRGMHNGVLSLVDAFGGLATQAGAAGTNLGDVEKRLTKLNGLTAQATLMVSVFVTGMAIGSWIGEKLGMNDLADRAMDTPRKRRERLAMDFDANVGGVQDKYAGDKERYMRESMAALEAGDMWDESAADSAIKKRFADRDAYVKWWVEQTGVMKDMSAAASAEGQRQEEEAKRLKEEADRKATRDAALQAALDEIAAREGAVKGEAARRKMEADLDRLESGGATAQERAYLDSQRRNYSKGRDGKYRDRSGNEADPRLAALLDADEKGVKAGNDKLQALVDERKQLMEQMADSAKQTKRDAYLAGIDANIAALREERDLRREKLADLEKEAQRLKDAAAAAWQLALAGGGAVRDNRRAERNAKKQAGKEERQKGLARDWAMKEIFAGAVQDKDGVFRDRFGKAFGAQGQARMAAVVAQGRAGEAARAAAREAAGIEAKNKAIAAAEQARKVAVDRMAQVDWKGNHEKQLARMGEIRDAINNLKGGVPVAPGAKPAPVAPLPAAPAPVAPRGGRNDGQAPDILNVIARECKRTADNVEKMGVG